MEVAGLALAIPALVESGYKWTVELKTRWNDYKDAEEKVGETINDLQLIWTAMRIMMQTLHEVWEEIPSDLQIMLSTYFHRMDSRTREVVARLDSLIGSPERFSSLDRILRKAGRVYKQKYAMSSKEELTKTMKELEGLLGLFNMCFLLLAHMPSQSLDDSVRRTGGHREGIMRQFKELRAIQSSRPTSPLPKSSMFLDPLSVKYLAETPIKFSTASVAILSNSASEHKVLVDRAPSSPAMSKAGVRNLARKFANLDPALAHILPCKGILQEPSSFSFVFEIPEGLGSLQTLRSALLRPRKTYTLTQRMELAINLAHSTLFLHQANFVHKNIRPETIILLSNTSTDQHNGCLGQPYLIGFDEIRREEDVTQMLADDVLEKNIYRHPDRQGLKPQHRYSMQHDIYSLGACLLEIGIWKPFVNYSPATGGGIQKPIPAQSFRTREKEPRKIKEKLMSYTKEHLPSLMGDTYTDVVMSCLSCLDEESDSAFGDLGDLSDQDGIIIGVRYVEKILEKLRRISV